jgi:tetratricopeptide (TPR) repeat protein
MPSIAELEEQAAAFSQQGDTAATERVCRDILAREPGHLSSLRFLADLALQAGDYAAAQTHLEVMRTQMPADLQLLSQLGQVLYRLGRLEDAAGVYEDYWRINPRKSMIYLTLGCLYVELGKIDKAAQVFSLGETVDSRLLSLWKNPDTPAAVAQMSKTAWETLRRHHTELHTQTVEALGDSGRIRDAVWPLLDARDINYQHDKQRAQVFYIRYPSSPPFFERETFAWCAQLESQYPELREEILAGLDVGADGRPYLGDGHQLQGDQWEPLVNKMSWASVHLYSRGVANAGVIGKFPKTLAALAQVPLATHKGNPAEVFISVLAPHTRIPEHYGVSSAILTAHLPIDVPPDCGLKVHEETRAPEAGRLMVFDDTWEHSAWNNSDQQRVVLIFELWHPELTEAERAAISRSFEAREAWLQSRSVD